MKIVCPWSDLEETTEFALKLEYWKETEFVDVRETGAYLQLMRQLWNAGETFILVEHDIVPWPGALRLMDECAEPFCLHEYPMGVLNYSQVMLGWGGCTKYGAKCMEHWPDALDSEIDWRNIMEHLITGLSSNGLPAHLHTPAVLHVSPERFKRPVTSMHDGLPGSWPTWQPNYPPTKERSGRAPSLWPT